MATATTRTRNLRLFLSSGLTAEAKANLEILDRLGDTTFLDGTETITFRAKTNLVLQPADENVNGTNGQGTISFATANNKALSMDFWPAVKATFHSPISVNGKLIITSANATEQTLTINTGAAPRVFTLGGDLTTTQSFSLQSTGSVTATVPAGEHTLATTTSAQTISNKVIDSSNTVVLTGKITNSDIAASANIEYSKLNLTNSVKASDFTTSAGRLLYNQLDLAGQLRNSDWSSDPNHRLSSEKINADFLTQEILTSGGFSAKNALGRKIKILAPNNVPNDYNFILPVEPGIQGQALAMLAQQPGQTEIRLGWVSTGTTVLNSGEVYVGLNGNPVNVNPGVLNSSDIIASVAEGLVLKPSGVASGTYGSATQSSQVTVDAKGRVTVAAPVAIDHDLLANFVADEHVAHTSVSINPAANGGLSGGGDITATRTLSVDPTVAVAKALPVGADTILLADSADSNTLKKTTLSALSSAIGVQSFKANWTEADTDPFVVTHNLNSLDTIVQVVDTANGETIGLNSILRSTNTVTLSGQNKPATFTWRVLILKV